MGFFHTTFGEEPIDIRQNQAVTGTTMRCTNIIVKQ
jgi:hypothetical protein